jgi:response regulator of citrate/malate metabolism
MSSRVWKGGNNMPSLAVLIADEDPMLRALYADYLKGIPGYALAAEADSGRALDSVLRAQAIDLVLLDIFLKGFGQVEGLRRTRALYPRVDLIVLSEGRDPDVVRGALCQGAFDYLIKPFTFQRFKAALEAYRIYNLGLTQRKAAWQQEELDCLVRSSMRARMVCPVLVPPKGVQVKLLNDVMSLLRTLDKPVSATDMGNKLKISRPTARRYLEHLVDAGVVEVEYAFRRVGRPVKLYRLKI